jgi:hypothetical protein
MPFIILSHLVLTITLLNNHYNHPRFYLSKQMRHRKVTSTVHNYTTSKQQLLRLFLP